MFGEIKIFILSFLLLFVLLPNTSAENSIEKNVSYEKSDNGFDDESDVNDEDYYDSKFANYEVGDLEKSDSDYENLDDYSDKYDPDEEDGDFDDNKMDPDDFEDESPAIMDFDYFYESENPEESSENIGDLESEKEAPDDLEEESENSEEEILGEESTEDEKEDPDDFEEELKEEKIGILENSLAFSLIFMSVPSDYYNLYSLIDVRYRNYSAFIPYPFYWSAGGAIGGASPNGDYPYTYQAGGSNLGPPTSYLTYTYGGLGYVYSNKEHEYSLFSELSLGIAFRMLYNNSFNNPHFGEIYPSEVTSLTVGGAWKLARFELSVSFDTNLEFMINGGLGITVPISSFRGLFKKKNDK